MSSFDAHPETLTLLCEDSRGRSAGTVTQYFDGPDGLPCDEVFPGEMASLRKAGRRVVEIGRLAIAPEHRRSRVLLLRMINALFIYSVRVKAYTDFVIEVHPCHTEFYRQRFGFEALSSPRACPRVEDAPAVLLRLDLKLYLHQMKAHDAPDPKHQPQPRMWYNKFIPLHEEPRIQNILADQRRSMSLSEARYFRLNWCQKVLRHKATHQTQ